MALFGYPALKIEFDDAVGGGLQIISQYVTAINGYMVEQILEETTGAGVASDTWAAVGFEQKQEITLSGPYDDTGNGLVNLTLNKEGELRTLKLTFDMVGATDTREVETLIRTTSRNPSRGAFHQYEVVLRPTGAVT